MGREAKFIHVIRVAFDIAAIVLALLFQYIVIALYFAAYICKTPFEWLVRGFEACVRACDRLSGKIDTANETLDHEFGKHVLEYRIAKKRDRLALLEKLLGDAQRKHEAILANLSRALENLAQEKRVRLKELEHEFLYREENERATEFEANQSVDHFKNRHAVAGEQLKELVERRSKM